jgi:hypothetical protein
MGEYDTSFYITNYDSKNIELSTLINNNCILYFPPNRFEDPGWLNNDHLKNRPDFKFAKKYSGKTRRTLINYSPLIDIQNWLLDIIYDRNILERIINMVKIKENSPAMVPILLGFEGAASNIYSDILNIFKLIFNLEENIRYGIGHRHLRSIEIFKDNEVLINNLFTLSTGETALINLFLTIIRDFDFTFQEYTTLENIRGIVIIDEIDLHLHTDLQYNVLPKLLSQFPKIQFIITTHSPLFLMGLKNVYGDNNFDILELPNGNIIDVEEFCEFKESFECYKASKQFQNEIIDKIENSNKHLLFFEGITDVNYINKTREAVSSLVRLYHSKIKELF